MTSDGLALGAAAVSVQASIARRGIAELTWNFCSLNSPVATPTVSSLMSRRRVWPGKWSTESASTRPQPMLLSGTVKLPTLGSPETIAIARSRAAEMKSMRSPGSGVPVG